MTVTVASDGALLLRDWAADVRALTREYRDTLTLDLMVRSGVSREDIDPHWATLSVLIPDDPSVTLAASLLIKDLGALAGLWPTMTMRAGLGWVLTCRSDPDLDQSLEAQTLSRVVVGAAVPWDMAGLRERGWLFRAAGVSVDEAAEQVWDGFVDWAALRTLAVLRGVCLPAAC